MAVHYLWAIVDYFGYDVWERKQPPYKNSDWNGKYLQSDCQSL